MALALGTTAALAGSAQAASPVPLATAGSFALLAGSTITNSGATTITGDIGLCCTGLATTGFGPGANRVTQPGGTQHVGPGSFAATAQDDLDIAYSNAAGQRSHQHQSAASGPHETTAHGALQVNTGLTLDFQGDPNAVFIFQGTALTTAAGAGGSMKIVNGGSAPSTCNIAWQLADATQGVTLGPAARSTAPR